MARQKPRDVAVTIDSVDWLWELPDGWQWHRMGDIGEWGSGGTPKANNTDYYGGPIPWVRSGELDRGAIRSTEKTLTNLGFENSSAKWVPEGALLIALYGANIGQTAITGIRCTTNQAVSFCIPRQADVGYLYRYVGFVKNKLCELGQGGAQPNISQAILKAFPIPLPDIEEQRRIVARVDELFVEIDDGERALAEARASLNTYRASLLNAAVTGELTAEWRRDNPPTETGADLLRRILADRRARWEANPRNRKRRYKEPSAVDTEALPEIPDGWAWATLEQIAYVSGGATVDKKRKPEEPLEVPYLRVANVQRGHLDLSTVKQITIEASALDALQLSDGDILLNEGGDRDKVGRGWVWRNELPLCIHQNHVFKARPASEIVRPEFVSAYLNEMGRRFFIEESKQTTNLASISLTKISLAPVPIPPPAETDAILRLLSTLQAPLDYDLMDAATSASATLRQSILSAAFRGELI